MKAVAALRNQFGGHAVNARPAEPWSGTRLSVHLYATCRWPTSARTPSVELPLEPGVTALVGPNGQGKTNLVEAVGYLATLGSHRVATDAPLVRLGAERARRPRQRRRATAAAHARRARDHPGQGQPGPGQPVAGPAAARGARHPAHRAVRAGGPRAGQGRPGRAAPVPRRPAGRARAAVRRRPGRLRPGAQAAQRPAEVGGAARPGQPRRQRDPTCAPSTSGTPTSPAPAPSCSPRGSSWSRRCARSSPRRTTRWPTPAHRVDAQLDYRCSLGDDVAADRPTASVLAAALLERDRARVRRRSSSAASPWSARTATTWCSGSGPCRPRGTRATASPGRTRWRCGWPRTSCCATDGGEPVLDPRRRVRRAGHRPPRPAGRARGARRAGAGHRRGAGDVPEALAGARVDVMGGEVRRIR